MRPRKYGCPTFIGQGQEKYEKWLVGRARAHVIRDKKRGNETATVETYKVAIHEAVVRSDGVDFYTGEQLDWTLLGRYSNAESKANRRRHKETLALLPTVDHVGDGSGAADFVICAWRTNDAKNDLSHDEFVELCRRVVAHYDRAFVARRSG
jgi:hypothetical protein